MNLEYNESEKFILIKDKQKLYYYGLLITLVIIIVSFSLNGFHFIEKQDHMLAILWLSQGIAALIILIYQLLKKSVAEKIDLHKIDSIIEKRAYGQIRLSLKLKNGKIRDLSSPESKAEFIELISLFEEIGLTVKGS